MISPIYSTLYLLLLFALLALWWVEYKSKSGQNTRKQAVYICAVVYILFFGLRGFVGWDWFNYYPTFQQTPSLFQLDKTSISAFSEFGFVIYMSIFKTLSLDYHSFVFFSAVIHVWLLSIFLNRYLPSGFYVFGFIIFLVMNGLVMEIDLKRNYKAILLFLISIKYIEKRKILPYFLLNAIGLMFHVSAIVFFPLYFFLHRPVRKNWMLIIFIIGLIIFFLQISFLKPLGLFVANLLGDRFVHLVYAYIFDTPYGITIGLLERLGSATLIYLCYDKLLAKSKSNIIFINSFILYFVVFFYFNEAFTISHRMGFLFIFSYWILWPSIIDALMIVKNKIIFIFLFSVYSILKMIGTTNLPVWRYDNILFGIEKYETRASELLRVEQYVVELRENN